MLLSEINIRDPFILPENGVYYMYGTRAANFGRGTGGFDVYSSKDLVTWSAPRQCFDSAAFGMNREVNWAPEVHRRDGAYYMFATFTNVTGLRGTFALRAERPEGPFVPWSDGPLTPPEWECLDGTLYTAPDGAHYLVFCHEHTQIIDGTVEYMPLTADLKAAAGAPETLFRGSSLPGVCATSDAHYVTDGPFMYTTRTGALLMVWSTFIDGKYAQCVARSVSGKIDGPFEHLPVLMNDDGGHGMLFFAGDRLCLTLHRPNRTDYERPHIIPLTDCGDRLAVGGQVEGRS